MTQSPDNSTIFGGSATITDTFGNTWGINSNAQVTVNGIADPTTSGVTELAYVGGLVWQESRQGLWWSKSSPSATWQPPAGVTTNPTLPAGADRNGTVIGASAANTPAVSITDASGNTWRIADGQVVVNGVVDPTTSNVIELAYENGQVWQETGPGVWWSKTVPSDAWTPATGTSANPVTGTFLIGNAAGDQAVVNVGPLTMSMAVPAAPLSVSKIITPGVRADGTTVMVDTSSAMLEIDGNSSLTNGATLFQLGAYRAPRPIYGAVQNNGDMIVNSSTAEIGALSGTGSIQAANGSTLKIQSANAGETIQLNASQLFIGGQGGGPATLGAPGGLSFLAPIALDALSSITLNATQATSEVLRPAAGSATEVLLYDGSALVADLTITGQSAINVTNDATAGSVTLTAAPVADPLPVTPQAPADPGVSLFDTSTSRPVAADVQTYTGPVAGLQHQYIATSTDNLNIATTTPNWFISANGFATAIDVSKGGGNNVLAGGGGSNFLTGGAGNDTFFVDDRAATTPIWSTIVGFHAGDNVTVWGVTPQDFGLAWLNDQGAPGDTGLTLSASAANKPAVNFTLAGYTSADLNNGRLTVAFGTTPNEPGLPGSTYLQVTAH